MALHPDYGKEISGIFEVGDIRIEGIYRTLPFGGYEIINLDTGIIQASGTEGSQHLVRLIREHTAAEKYCISFKELGEIIKKGQEI